MFKARYVLFNVQTHRAVSYGNSLEDLCIEARKCSSITGEPYRVYDTETKQNVYLWPVDDTVREENA